MFKQKLTASSLIFYFLFLMLTPLLGWHVHPACAEGTHGVEFHTTQTHKEHHGRECGPETLYEYAFEQGATLSHSNWALTHIPDFILVAPSLSTYLENLPSFESQETHPVALDFDIGHSPYFQSSIAFRAPPQLLA